jgi:hypothetical protein
MQTNRTDRPSGGTAQAHADAAIRRAQELVETHPEHRDARWYYEAHHVGDLAVVAAALRG